MRLSPVMYLACGWEEEGGGGGGRAKGRVGQSRAEGEGGWTRGWCAVALGVYVEQWNVYSDNIVFDTSEDHVW